MVTVPPLLLSDVILPLLRVHVIAFGIHLDNPGWSPPVEIHNFIISVKPLVGYIILTGPGD